MLIPVMRERFGWRRFPAGERALLFRGHVAGRTPEILAREAASLSRAAVPAWLDRLDGHFSLVLTGPDWSLAAVDPVRSYPLIWARREGAVLVASNGPALVRHLGLGPVDIDADQAAAFALSGFTVGAATLYRGVRQLSPGKFILVEAGGETTETSYHVWRPQRPDPVTPEELVAPLAQLHEKLIGDLIVSAAGRPILVPLSAGLDSRMIASGLAAAGYRNVQCFAYGRAGNREAVVSSEIARRLGYPWRVVPYTNAVVRASYESPDHQAYLAYADNLTAIPFPQDYPALDRMRRDGALDPDSILVNGQSGDFITGNHVPAALFSPRDDGKAARLERILDALVAKHFKNWTSLRTPKRMAGIKALLTVEIDAAGGLPDDPAGDHGVYEASEFVDRQSKYVINGQRVYEYLGLDWRLPLWDRAYIDFWARAPLAAKKGQNLYRQVLERENWGGVWRDVPVNPLRIRPLWLVPLRLAAKAAHAPLGQARWRRFEKQYLEYWMAPLCSYAPWSYRQVATDKRGHASPIGWYIERYLAAKGPTWSGGL